MKEKINDGPELSFLTLFIRVIRSFLLLSFALIGAGIAWFGAFEGEWTKAIFGLVLMMAADYRFDKIHAYYKKKEDELIRDSTEADRYREKVQAILSESLEDAKDAEDNSE